MSQKTSLRKWRKTWLSIENVRRNFPIEGTQIIRENLCFMVTKKTLSSRSAVPHSSGACGHEHTGTTITFPAKNSLHPCNGVRRLLGQADQIKVKSRKFFLETLFFVKPDCKSCTMGGKPRPPCAANVSAFSEKPRAPCAANVSAFVGVPHAGREELFEDESRYNGAGEEEEDVPFRAPGLFPARAARVGPLSLQGRKIYARYSILQSPPSPAGGSAFAGEWLCE
jgi:hypothetical protein